MRAEVGGCGGCAAVCVVRDSSERNGRVVVVSCWKICTGVALLA